MKRHIAITLVFMIFAMLFSGCGSTRINYNLYEDAIANFKNQSQMQIKITQDITSIISGGSSTTTSSVSIDAVDLNNAPIYQAKGSIYAIGAGASTKIIDGSKIDRIFNVKEVSEYIKRIDEMIDRKKQFLEKAGL